MKKLLFIGILLNFSSSARAMQNALDHFRSCLSTLLAIHNPDQQLLEACYNSDITKSFIALKAGADSNCKKRSYGSTPLHIASIKGNCAIISLLLANNADINANNKLHQTSLHFAIYNGHKNCVELLLKTGADTQKKAIDSSDSFLEIAKNTGKIEIYHLLKNHYDLLLEESRNSPTENTLFKAVYNNYIDIVKIVLGKNIKPVRSLLCLANKLHYKELYILLITHLNITPGQSAISKQAIPLLHALPTEIKQYIVSLI
jgi:ankyrin repeat protein